MTRATISIKQSMETGTRETKGWRHERVRKEDTKSYEARMWGVIRRWKESRDE